ncbi:diguanylate cyclase (GGDEF)-like protein/PAS domain S-box-containing protein [Lysobacter niabensis]|uniref:Diguanylate cyclase (GGDEF)-like protein/PAS domain S-box-containing protein n=1 Tax=Agrilutibacter niabensis TaxID=380628 RepID=A0ABU1VTC7_9GAMM|nr:EAL domain-containing protein [Lysobacter niabensis]MDR7100737.1 diguanylate cyclase (GGDEF)-like protein/PAS domain S-box-containing protein [Lysobacter niabensis]
MALIAGLLGAGIARDAGALTRDYYFERIGSARGLGQNTVNALAQDAQGFVWVATQGGLHRYDGQRYVQYRHDPRDPTSLPDSYVTALAIDAGKSLWVGSYSQYVSRLDLTSGEIQRYEVSGDEQAQRHVAALLPHAGKVWVGTFAGLERLDPATGTRDRVITLDPRALRKWPRQALVAGREGEVWYGAQTGLYRIGARGGVERMRPALSVRALTYDHRGQLWIGATQGLYRLASDGRSLLRVWPADGEPEIEVGAIVEAPDHRLWLSLSAQGVLRFDPATGRSLQLREQSGVTSGLAEDSFNALMIDRGGMLWLGGQFRGVTVADPRGTRFNYVLDLETGPGHNAATDDSVRTVAQDTSGALWIGTDNARLLRYDIAGDRFEDYTPRLPLPTMPVAPRVMAMVRDRDGSLWAATEHGLMRLDPRSGSIEQVPLGSYTNVAIRSLMLARNGALWMGTADSGALRYSPDDGEVLHYGYRDGDRHQLSHPAVHAMLEDRRGRIWLGTGDGLDLLDPATGQLRHYRHGINAPDSLPGNLVRALLQAADGRIWVGTHAGLSRVIETPDGGIAFAHPLADALRDRLAPVVFSIAEAPAGTLWLGTDNGITRFDTANDHYRTYGLADGLQDLEFNGAAVTRLGDGRLAFGGVRGLNLFDPRRASGSGYVPPLRLLSARIGAEAPINDGVLWHPQSLSIPDGAELLRLRVGALDYAPSADIQYRYRLEGFDPGWIDNGHQQDITYTKLPAGDYVLRVQATNRDGAWNSQELSVPIRVMPPWWRHPRVVATGALALLALALALAWRHHQQVRRERGLFEAIREREQRLKLALWGSGEIFWDYDLRRGEMHAMRIDEHGILDADKAVQMEIVDQHEVHPDDLSRLRDLLRQHVRGESPLLLSEHRVRMPDGYWAWMLARGRVVDRDASGRALRIAGTARDVTTTRNAERERRIASEVLRSMGEAVCVFDRDFAFVSVNPAFTRMTGYSDVEVLGRDTSLLNSTQHDPEFYRQMRFRLERDGRWSGELWQQRKDGQEFLCSVQASVVLDATGQRSHYVGVLGDITDQKRAEQELRYLANYDTLTSLPNRTLLSERLSRAIVRARRQGKRIAVLFLDLDRFKDINDSLGHAAGDRILRAAAARLQNTVGPQHTVARLGGDEFTVVLEDVDIVEQAEEVARMIIDAFGQPLDIDDRHDVSISPSIGISLYPDHAQIPTDLLKHADTAMYQAKAAGRRTFMRYTDAMDVEIRQRATISAALRKVLDRNELRLVFQPKLSLTQMRITGVEALLRWHSPEYGDIPPDRFIPLAEESGLILEIGEWAMQEACSTLQRWREQGLVDVSMAVNVSALQLARGHLANVVARALSGRGIPPDRLQLELTETVIMANAGQNATMLQAIRDLGVGLAIDDFGTGYSSLSYLKRLPLTTLKIDKEFIGDLTHDADDEAITGAVIAMAHSLGLTVVAEGVETEAQVKFLHDHGCDEIQGYWLARPLHADECLAFLHSWATAAVETDCQAVPG